MGCTPPCVVRKVVAMPPAAPTREGGAWSKFTYLEKVQGAPPQVAVLVATRDIQIAEPITPSMVQVGVPGLPRTVTGGTIALTGNAGGAGKSQLAANLAATLGILGERRVALVDLDPINASLHDTLGLVVPPGKGLDALHAAAAPLVREAVRHATAERAHHGHGQDNPLARVAAQEAVAALDPAPYLLRFPQDSAHSPGIDVLTGVTSMAAADRVAGDLETLYALLHLLRERYDDVVLDLGTDTTTVVHEGLAARSDLLLVVTWPTPDGIERVAAHHVRLMRATGLDPARCRLVINHVPSDASPWCHRCRSWRA